MAEKKGKAKSKAVAKKADAGLIKASDLGIEQIVDTELLIIPRLKLVQRMSEEIDEGIPYLSLVNSATKSVLAAGTKDGASVVIIPILVSRSRAYFKDLDDGGGVLCRAEDARLGVGDPGGDCSKCPNRVGSENVDGDWEKPLCTEFINVSCIVRGNDNPLPFVLSFAKTSAKYGRQFYNLLVPYISEGLALLNFAFTVKSMSESSDQFTYGVIKVSPEGYSTPEERTKATAFLKVLQEAQVAVHDPVSSAADDDKVFNEDD